MSAISGGCGFAHPGTYGHECGSPAVVVGIRPSTDTKSGVFYARRCPVCAKFKGGDNLGIIEWVPYDPAQHINQWR